MPSVLLEEEACRAAAQWRMRDYFKVRHALCGIYPQRFDPNDPHEREWVGNLDSAINEARQIAQLTARSGSIWMNIDAFCDRMRGRFDFYQPNTTKYIYTLASGLIDLLHFYSCMKLIISSGRTIAICSGIAVENFQLGLGLLRLSRGARGSAWSPEDMPSNYHGAEFGYLLKRRYGRPQVIDPSTGGTQLIIEIPVVAFIGDLRAYLTALHPVPREQLDMDRLVAWYNCPSRRDGRPHIPRADELISPELLRRIGRTPPSTPSCPR